MPSTFSPNKLYELMATGEKSGTWGTVANTNVFSIIDSNMGGRVSVNCAGNTNITITDTQAKNLYHTLTGLLTGNIQYIVPTRGSFYFITNSTTGAFTITVIQASGTGVVIPQGSTALVFVNPDGTPAVTIPQNYMSALTLAAALPLASGGTAGTSAATAMANLGTAITLTAGTGLTGGGDLTTSRSFAISSIADLRVFANISGGSAAPSANTLTAIIDACIGSTQGDILYRDAASWAVLAPGTSGQFLKTQGAAANPTWSDISTNVLTLQEQGSTPSTPASGFGAFYEKSDNNLYFLPDSGVETEVLTAANVAAGITSKNTVKAYAMFTQSGTTVTFTSGNWFNVASVSRTGIGVYTITFTNALPTANYVVIGGGTGVSVTPLMASPSSLGTGSFTLTTLVTTQNNTPGEVLAFFSFLVLGF